MKKLLFPLFAGITAFLAFPASAESLKVQLTRPVVIEGKNFAPGTYYIHTPSAGDNGPILIVNAATGSEVTVMALRTSLPAAKPHAVFSRQGREDRLKAIRTSSANFEFPDASQIASAE